MSVRRIFLFGFCCYALQVKAQGSCDIALEELKLLQSENIELVCIAVLENTSGQMIRAQTQVNLGKKTMTVLLDNTLSGSVLSMSLQHELAHATQYNAWFDSSTLLAKYKERLEKLHSLLAPTGLNSAYQTLARLKQHSWFRIQPEQWLQAYASMHFCMEYQAWHKEAELAQREAVPVSKMTAEVTAIVNGDEHGLAAYINSATINDIFPEGFNTKQLEQARESCPKSNNPVEMFRVSVQKLIPDWD